MFGFLRRRKSPKAAAVADIEEVFLSCFQDIREAAKEQFPLQQRFKIVVSFAATIGAMRERYPNFPIEQDSMAVALVQANAEGHDADVEGLIRAAIDMVKRCPDRRSARIETVTWMIAPSLTSN